MLSQSHFQGMWAISFQGERITVNIVGSSVLILKESGDILQACGLFFKIRNLACMCYTHMYTHMHMYVCMCVYVGMHVFLMRPVNFSVKKTCSDTAIVIAACHRVKTLDLVVSVCMPGNRLRAVIGEIKWSLGTQSRDCSSVRLYTWALRTSKDCCGCVCLDFVITLQTKQLRIDCIAFLPLCDMCVVAW